MRILLSGNPNTGKTSLFNLLTGLNHKVGNYPGVTVDRREGQFKHQNKSYQVLDVPGSYSIFPKSKDELVAVDTLLQWKSLDDGITLVVIDAANIKRSLFYCSQVMDLGLPVIGVLTMQDVAIKNNKKINTAALASSLGIPLVEVNPRTGEGLDSLKHTIEHYEFKPQNHFQFFASQNEHADTDYRRFFEKINQVEDHHDGALRAKHNEELTQEVLARYRKIEALLAAPELRSKEEIVADAGKQRTRKVDKILLHPVLGYVILFVTLLLVFQAVFWLAGYPMDAVDAFFGWATELAKGALPDTWWAGLLTDGVLAGIGGVVIFIPQIAILFFLITILEDSGYMARINFLMDRLFQSSGLSGKSVMPIISGMACAIPAVMAARNIEHRSQRLITILVAPFMSCSARLPVYAILIALVIPEEYYFGFLSLQGLVLLGMYLLGFVTALVAAKILSFFIGKGEPHYFIQEMPVYQNPRWGNAFSNMYDKSKIFLFNAGKIILLISVIIWGASTYGPGSLRDPLEARYAAIEESAGALNEEQRMEYSSALLETSYMGIMGKAIEPAIRPLGYDWKIGIGLLASFAAREVFVPTMGIIYGIEDEENEDGIKAVMQQATRADGRPVFDFATGMSLMIFYAFAMQCMATVAAVRREAGGWKMALLQLVMMTGLAYVAALIVYQILK